MTFIPSLTFTELWVVSVEHLQRVWLASRERLPFRTPGSVPHFGTCYCSNCWDQIPRTCHVFTRLFTSNTPWYFLDFTCNSRITQDPLRSVYMVSIGYFNFHITNFPFLSSNIPSSPAYGVFISQLIRYARACSSYECFILRAARLSSKLLRQGYVKERLKSSLRKFYGRYGDLIKHYEVSLSQMLHDILGHDHIQWHPQLIRHYTNLRTYYRTGL